MEQQSDEPIQVIKKEETQKSKLDEVIQIVRKGTMKADISDKIRQESVGEIEVEFESEDRQYEGGDPSLSRNPDESAMNMSNNLPGISQPPTRAREYQGDTPLADDENPFQNQGTLAQRGDVVSS